MPDTFHYKFNSDVLFSELYLTEAGWEICQPGHTFGPAVRDYFLLHYIASGKGRFMKNGKTYHLSSGNAFVIFPSEVTTYAADEKEPWIYYWVGFSGSLASKLLHQAGITPAAPTHTIDAPCEEVSSYIKDIHFALTVSSGGNLKGLGLFLLFLSLMSPVSENLSAFGNTSKLQEEYLSKAIHYVQEHYMDSLSVSMISDYVGIERSYLYRIFQSYLHMGVQEYVLSFRIHKASQLLIETNLPIGNIASMTGFSSPTAFGVAFRQFHELSPRAFRKVHGGILRS